MSRLKLPPRQQRFVEEYVVDLNATQAAIRAGYSTKTAGDIGPRLVGKSRVAAAIASAQAARGKRTGITADRVLTELATVGYSDIAEIFDTTGQVKPVREIPEATRRAISGVKVRRYVERGGTEPKTVEVLEFKLWPKTDALTKLGDHLGLWKNPLAGSIDELRRFFAQMLGIAEEQLPK